MQQQQIAQWNKATNRQRDSSTHRPIVASSVAAKERVNNTFCGIRTTHSVCVPHQVAHGDSQKKPNSNLTSHKTFSASQNWIYLRLVKLLELSGKRQNDNKKLRGKDN